ncbi:LOW QUALITY PROTEIN: agamous-like MADS-box protein AGL97 [Arabidopsis lyrata subsp. lyrata]|uniref:LOW QUALITY PROTEIN: agamous-like MADS-box protein AGL97 n=1 Tax=Arabidopsis lyrata subsp. lyrata TaxID=81972 RepID=UPI000A29D151|nr:LOW QUALITY PROTEIN: agamous-like MADS-box protein AGL97 [Arabidopsis lyrata subsp. lyrata]|eukprot:XP_020879307.1 LOW QUALITY PROTEIN: agamous-like MADS-box protein AGL97 [Arabidopsis lyrata subsp. lyrata]
MQNFNLLLPLATPVSSNSNVSFYTFGHSSVDNVVAAFLANQQRPREGLGLGFWWEDEKLAKSEDPEELRDAMDSMSKMLKDLKELRFNALENRRDCVDVKKKGVLHGTHQKQTLSPQSFSASLCILDDVSVNFNGFKKNTEEQTLAVSNNSSNNNGLLVNLDGCNQDFDLDEIFDYVTTSEALSMNLEMDDVSTVTTSNQNPFSCSETFEGGELVIHRNLDEDNIHLSDLDDDVLHLSDLDEDQILAISDNNKKATTYDQNPCSDSEAVVDGELVIPRDFYENNIHLSDLDEDQMLMISDNNNVLPENLSEFDQELDLDQLIDFETNCESLLKSFEMDYATMVTTKQNLSSNSEAVEDGGLIMIQKDLNGDNLCFSDYFNEL